MRGNIFENITKIIEKKTADKITHIKNENIKNVSFNKTDNPGQRVGIRVPVNFFVFFTFSGERPTANIQFTVSQQDEKGNPIDVLIYKIYRDSYDEDSELRAEDPVLVGEISSSLIKDQSFTFKDNSYNSGSIVFYTMTCVDSTGVESPFGEWEEYSDSFGFPNDLVLNTYTVLPDKSINMEFDIKLKRVYENAEIGYIDEKELFDDAFDRVLLFKNSSLAEAFDSLEINYQPKSLTETLNVFSRNIRGGQSIEGEIINIGGVSPDIEYNIGQLNAESCSVEEDVYINNDGTSISRVKINLASSVAPSNILVKIQREGKLGIPDTEWYTVYDGEYDTTIYLEQGGTTGFQILGARAIGSTYNIKVYVKTHWGLIKTSPDFEGTIELKGSEAAPSPVHFSKAPSGTGSAIVERYFDLDWSESVDFDDDMYEVRISKPEVNSWDNAVELYKGRATKFVYNPEIDDFNTYSTNREIKFWIKSFNARGTGQDNASWVKLTNNIPSKPSTPSIANRRSGFEVSWNKNTEKDISHYLFYVSKGQVWDDPLIVQGNSYTVSTEPGEVYKFKIKAVDIYDGHSVESDETPDTLAAHVMTKDSVSIYPSGDVSGVIDKGTINGAIDYLNSVGGGKIYVSAGDYYIDINSPLNGGNHPISIESMGNRPVLNFLMSTASTKDLFSQGSSDTFEMVGFTFKTQEASKVLRIIVTRLNMRDCFVTQGRVNIQSGANSIIRDCDYFAVIILGPGSFIKNLTDFGLITVLNNSHIEDCKYLSIQSPNTKITTGNNCTISNSSVNHIEMGGNASCLNCRVLGHIDQHMLYSSATNDTHFTVDGCTVSGVIGQTLPGSNTENPSEPPKGYAIISNSQAESISQGGSFRSASINNCRSTGSGAIDDIMQSGIEGSITNSTSTRDIKQNARLNNARFLASGNTCRNLIQDERYTNPTNTKGIATGNFISGALTQTMDTNSESNNIIG